ncbi:MAG: hypothetical protein R2836_09705 [Chitinophagales bacterium]|nr:hypothetical protein [Chitinophagales bacterium]
MNKELYISLANVFQYPTGDEYIENLEACYQLLKKHSKEAAETFKPLLDYANTHTLHDIEEVFAKTFHIQALCYLDLGYVLFGEDYKRGEFLVQMQREMKEHNIDTGCELSDNLPFILLLLTKKDEEFVEEFVANVLQPCMKMMLVEFSQSRIDFRNRVMKRKYKIVIQQELTKQEINLYEHALRALEMLINKDYKNVKPFEKKTELPTLQNNLDSFMNQNNVKTGCQVYNNIK